MPGDSNGVQQSNASDMVNAGVRPLDTGPGASGGPERPWTPTPRAAPPSPVTQAACDTTVFVSYTHDTPEHVIAVLRLAELLMASGVQVWIDQWAGVQRRDWGGWATEQITKADFVVVVASPAYCRVGDGLAITTDNRGGQSESATIRDLLHADRATWRPKLLPVVLPGHTVSEIPLFLQPYSADHYLVSELTAGGIVDLLRVLTGQPKWVPPARGTVPLLSPRPSVLAGLGPKSADAVPDHASSGIEVFISYAREDGALVRPLARRLRDEGFVVFLAEWEIVSGDLVIGELERAIGSSEAGIVVFSKASARQSAMLEEYYALMSRAVDGRGRLIPVLLDDVELPPFAANRRAVDLSAGQGLPMGSPAIPRG